MPRQLFFELPRGDEGEELGSRLCGNDNEKHDERKWITNKDKDSKITLFWCILYHKVVINQHYMHIVAQLQSDFLARLKGLIDPKMVEDHESKIVMELCRQRELGDYSTNAAFILAKPLATSPLVLAREWEALVASFPYVKKVAAAAPGFLNITLDKGFYAPYLLNPLPPRIGSNHPSSNPSPSQTEENDQRYQKVNVEFVSANPTGPLHTGHGRNAVFGDVVGNMLRRLGHDVTKEYYVNDAGGQMVSLVYSVYWRYCELLETVVCPEIEQAERYQGDYIKLIAQNLIDEDGQVWIQRPIGDWFDRLKNLALGQLLDEIKKDLETLGVVMDNYVSEQQLQQDGLLDKAIDHLKKMDTLYYGMLEKPKGIDHHEDWEERDQLLFRSTDYGDDIDRCLQKSDGSWTYFAGDISYHYDKINRGYDRLINVFGADHIGYITRLKAAVKAMAKDTDFEIKSTQLVHFLDNGVAVRMSKRTGNFITIRDVIERVGKDATRFMMVCRGSNQGIDFDFAKVVEQSRDNPIFYIQYAYARACSVLRHSATLGHVNPAQDPSPLIPDRIGQLLDDDMIRLVQIIIDWPKQLILATRELEPHRITNYLYDLASEFHHLWNLGKEKTHLRFVVLDQRDQTRTHLIVLQSMLHVLKDALETLGITPIEEMR